MTKHVRRIMRPSQVAISYAKISLNLRLAVWHKYEMWACVSHNLYTQALECRAKRL